MQIQYYWTQARPRSSSTTSPSYTASTNPCGRNNRIFSDFSKSSTQQNITETPDSSLKTHESASEETNNMSLRSVSEMEELLILLEPTQDGGRDVDIESITENQPTFQMNEIVEEN